MEFRYSLWMICILVTLQAPAQVKNIRIDELGSTSQVCSPSIAINPRDTKNWVISTNVDHVFYTLDGGVTWTKSQLVNPNAMHGMVTIVVSEKGDFYCFHSVGSAGNRSIVCRQSRDGGKTWDEGVVVNAIASKDQQMPRAAIDDKGNLFVSWSQLDVANSMDPNCLSTIQLSASSNGKKWSKPVELSQTPGNCNDGDNTVAGAMPAVSFDGKVFAGWVNQDKLFLDRSFDGGSMWLRNDIAVSKQAGGWLQQIPGHDRVNAFPVLQTDRAKLSPARGTMFLTWADQRNGEQDTDVWFLRSVNFGDYWTTPLNINEDQLGTHQYAPWMAVDQVTGYVYIIYFNRPDRDSNQTDVYLAYSINSGSSFKNVKISENSFVPDAASKHEVYTSLSVHKGVIAAAWARVDQGVVSVWTCSLRHDELEKIVK